MHQQWRGTLNRLSILNDARIILYKFQSEMFKITVAVEWVAFQKPTKGRIEQLTKKVVDHSFQSI